MGYDGLLSSLRDISATPATDAKSDVKGAHWVTTEEGHHILIRDKDGAIVSFGKASEAIRAKINGDTSSSGSGDRPSGPADNANRIIDFMSGKGLAAGVSTDKAVFNRLLNEHQRKFGGKRIDALGFYNTADGKIYLDADRLTAKTALHEFSHPFLDKLRASKTEAERKFWERGIQLVKEAGLSTPDDDAYNGLSEEDAANEVLADRMAEHGKGILEDTNDGDIDEKMRDYGDEFYRKMGVEFGIENINPEHLARMTLDEWVAAADAHMFGMKQEQDFGKRFTGSDAFLGLSAGGELKFNTRTWDEGGAKILKDALDQQSQVDEDDGGLSEEDAKAIYDETQKVYDICKRLAGERDEDGQLKYASFAKWCNAEVVMDEEGRPYYGVKVPNGDYKFNFDFSTVCKKRRPLDAIFAALIDRGVIKADENGFINLNPATIAKMQKSIEAAGLEVACALCFVDSKRYTIASDTYKFVAGWNGLVDKCKNDRRWWAKRIKGIEEKVAKGGKKNFIERMAVLMDLADLKQRNPREFQRRLEASRAKPKAKRGEVDEHLELVNQNPDVIKSLDAGMLLDGKHLKEFASKNPPIYDMLKKNGGAHKAKDSFLDNPWYSDILRPFSHLTNSEGEKDIDREAAYAIGGVRLQSFSDFVPSMTFDYMQMMSEMATKRLPMHTYTKEPSFVKIFGKTGAKINMSLVPAGDGLKRDKNGKVMRTHDGHPVYDIGNQTFPEQEAYKLRNGNPNVGTIMVGASDDHIREALRDDRIDMVIPYHKSGINPAVAEIRGIAEHVDYSDSQHTKGPNGKAFKSEPYDFYAKLGELKDPRKVAKDYLRFCKAKGFTPKFEKFADEPNYFKLLADFRLYGDDGKYAPQGDVRITKDTYKGVLPHIRKALQAHEDDQRKLAAALGTKSRPGKLFKDLVRDFFTGDKVKDRELAERALAGEKWNLETMLNSSGTGEDSADETVAWSALMHSLTSMIRAN